ncbi:MAG: YceI family protein [Ignavibacteriae bacterium]|nr:YceI family protein [Ignavibacteriota bacterium]
MKKYLIALTILILMSSLSLAEEWHIKKSKDNLVKFTSSTTLLDFDGITDQIDGYIYWEGEEVFGKNNEVYFEVDLNSVETGIGKRDRDMREDVLHTDKYPKTSFRGQIISVDQDPNNSVKYNIVSKGKMFLHGHEKEMEVKAVITKQNETMQVIANFSVLLKDYDIEAPSLMAFIKVAEEIKLHLDFQLEKMAENKN